MGPAPYTCAGRRPTAVSDSRCSLRDGSGAGPEPSRQAPSQAWRRLVGSRRPLCDGSRHVRELDGRQSRPPVRDVTALHPTRDRTWQGETTPVDTQGETPMRLRAITTTAAAVMVA